MSPEAPVAVAPELEGKAPAAETPVEVEVGGKTLKVDKATAEAITAFKTQVAEAGKVSKEQFDQLTAQINALKPKETPKAPAAADLENLIFTNPKEALRLMKEEVRAEVKEEIAALNSQISSTNDQKAFWTEFYSENADLKDADFLVKSVLARDFKKFEKMQVPEAIKALAETVKADILKLAGKKTPKDPAATLEGGNERRPKPSKEGEAESKDSPTSITDVLKARRASRRSGAQRATA